MQRTIFLAPLAALESIVYFYGVRTVISGKSYRPSSDKYLFVGGILYSLPICRKLRCGAARVGNTPVAAAKVAARKEC